jgi:hypothetical protein
MGCRWCQWIGSTVVALLLIAGQATSPPGLAQDALANQELTLQKLADYPLPGDTSRYDYQSFDRDTHRLYFAHLGMGVVRVFDTAAHALVGNVETCLASTELSRCPSSAWCMRPQRRPGLWP